MKRFLVILLVLTLFSGVDCHSQSREEKKAMKVAAVKEKLNSGIFKIDITHIIPANMPMRSTYSSYYLEFKKDTFTCYLPYIGTATTAMIGGQNLSIESEKQKVDIRKSYNEKEKYTDYLFNFINSSMKEKWQCSMFIYDTGECRLRMDNAGRQSIAYDGDIYFESVPKKKKEKKEKH